MSVDDVFGNSPTAENFGAAISQPPEVPEIKFRVPSAPCLAQEKIAAMLAPYEYAIQQAEAMLLLRRPKEFMDIVLAIQSVLVALYLFSSGLLSDACVIFCLAVLCVIVFKHNRELFMTGIFRPLDDFGRPDEPNRIYTIDEIARFISVIGSRVHCFFLGCRQKATDKTVVGQLLWLSFLSCCFVAASILKTRVVLYFLVNVVLILPGIVFHPAVYPKISSFLTTLMTTIAPKMD